MKIDRRNKQWSPRRGLHYYLQLERMKRPAQSSSVAVFVGGTPGDGCWKVGMASGMWRVLNDGFGGLFLTAAEYVVV